AAPDLLVQRGHREHDTDLGARGGICEDVEVANDHRAARDQAERVGRVAKRLEAPTRELVAPFRGLVRVGGRADRDRLAPPGGSRELAAQHRCDVDLDPDRAAVAVVGRPVGSKLERSHVTERAPVGAAHVRVQRPAEPHALHPVQRAAARLFAILDLHPAMIEHTFAPVEIAPDVLRLTYPMPMSPGHVHGYLLRVDDGYLLVDTGLGLPDLAERWAELTPRLDRPVAGVVITHFHPDHVGGAADAVEATGAPVRQGALDYEQCETVWGSDDWGPRIADWFHVNGAPPEATTELLEAGSV